MTSTRFKAARCVYTAHDQARVALSSANRIQQASLAAYPDARRTGTGAALGRTRSMQAARDRAQNGEPIRTPSVAVTPRAPSVGASHGPMTARVAEKPVVNQTPSPIGSSH